MIFIDNYLINLYSQISSLFKRRGKWKQGFPKRKWLAKSPLTILSYVKLAVRHTPAEKRSVVLFARRRFVRAAGRAVRIARLGLFVFAEFIRCSKNGRGFARGLFIKIKNNPD